MVAAVGEIATLLSLRIRRRVPAIPGRLTGKAALAASKPVIIGKAFSAWATLWVLGLETDFQGSEINSGFSRVAPYLGSTFFDAKQGIDYFGTVRGRIGYAIGNTLIYGTGGLAYGNVITKIRLSNLGTGVTDYLRNVGTETGYAVGGGLEYVFAPGWSAKLEYQYIDLGDQSLSGVASNGEIDRTKVDNSFNTLRVGLNYHLQNDYVPLK